MRVRKLLTFLTLAVGLLSVTGLGQSGITSQNHTGSQADAVGAVNPDGTANVSDDVCYATGDVNGSGGADPTLDDVTIGDVSALIDHIYFDQLPLLNPVDADINGDCVIDTLDIAALYCMLFIHAGTPCTGLPYPTPTCCDPVTRFPGTDAVKLGEAVVTEESDGWTVDNVGASGGDGIRLYPEDGGYAAGFRANLENVLLDDEGDGFQLKFDAYAEELVGAAQSAGPSLRNIGLAGVTNVNGRIQITANFNPIGDPQVEFRTLLQANSLITGRVSVTGGGVIAQGTAPGAAAQVTSVAILANTPPSFSIRFDRVVQFTLATSPPVVLVGDEVHLVAMNSAYSIAGLGPASMTGSYLGWFALNSVKSSACCLGFVGNANMDPTDAVTLGDVSALIDFLYINNTPLTCLEEADANLSGTLVYPPLDDEDITLGDISMLIDYLFISQTPLPLCP